ncbi:MAG: TlpA family protein disulfide reductase [Chloroflexi bacterium]|nr:MAG: TlpA family protein disulfide reductase [Chloroflexota bacterium]
MTEIQAVTSATKRQRKSRRQRQRQQRLNVIFGVVSLLAVVVVAYILISNLSTRASSSGEILPTFTRTALDGSTVTSPDPDRQATVVFAMAYWCGTCLPESRALVQLQQEFGDAVRIIMVDIDPSSTPALLRDFMNVVGPGAENLSWVFDAEGILPPLSRSYNLQLLDATVIVDNEGREVFRDGRPTSYDTLRDALEEVIEL